jgi:hypothetical protein
MASERSTVRVRISGRTVRVGTNRSGRQPTGPSQQLLSCLPSSADTALQATRSNRETQPLAELVQSYPENVTAATKAPRECSNLTSTTSLAKTIPEIKAKTIPEIIACLTVAKSVLVEGSTSQNEPSTAFVVCLLTDVLKVIQGYGHEDDQEHVN